MAVIITDEGATVLVMDEGVPCYLDKSTLSIGVEGGANMVLKSGDKKAIFAYADVTSPLEASAEDLASAIEDMKETAGGSLPAGAATEAKQDDIIAELQNKPDEVTGIGHGSKTVASAGTDEALSASSIPAKHIIITAYDTNTTDVAIGGSGVDASASGDGLNLSAGDAVDFAIADVSDVYVDAQTNGEGVRYTYLV